MDQIARDMRYGLPNQAYLEFAARHLLQQRPERSLVDPFALQLPTEKVKDVYVTREVVENEINQPGTVIVMGAEGGGKTTLFESKLLTLSLGQSLVVGLPLTQVGVSVPEQELMDGKISLLTLEVLIRYIFNAYWENLVCSGQHAEYLSQLRRNLGWMTRFRWFYQQFPPVHPVIPEEFELMTWLNASSVREPFSLHITPESTLRELVQLVTFAPPPRESIGVSIPRLYTHIQVLVDGAEYLSSKAITRLAQDAQQLYNLHLVRFNLFVVSTWQDLIETMACVQGGRARVYHLPQWNEKELRQLLYFRLKGWREGDPVEPPGRERYDWSDIPGLAVSAKPRFTETIIESALRTYSVEDIIDAPVHALRLARGLVAACAGCWKEQGYAPPLELDKITELADRYWQIKGEEDGDFSES
jgi:hypothetical protein